MKQNLYIRLCLLSMLLAASTGAAATIRTVTLSYSALSPSTSSGNLVDSPQDDDGETWEFKAKKTTYSSLKTDYIQIGSKSNPSTDITFTTTFPQDQEREITSFIANIGGNAGKKRTVTLEIDKTEVASKTYSDGDGISVSSSKVVRGRTLTVTVSSINEAVDFYYIQYSYVTPVSEDVTISAAKYATYCSENKLNFSGMGVTAYMAKANGTGVALTEIEDGIVPAGAGVVLYSETPNTYTIPTTSATPTNYDAAENELVGITARTLVRADNGDGRTNYILSNEASGVGFYRAAADGAYLRANRAYLSTTVGSSAVAAFLSFLDDEEDDVKTIVSEQQTKHNVVFDVVGRRAVPHQRGLYIRNGKKFFVK